MSSDSTAFLRRPSTTTSTTASSPDTRAGDGDHTDALLLIDEPTFPGCRVWARPVGGLEMRDEKGFDFKVLCVAVADPHQAHVERLDAGPTAPPRRDRALLRDLQAARGQGGRGRRLARARSRRSTVLAADRRTYLGEHADRRESPS